MSRDFSVTIGGTDISSVSFRKSMLILLIGVGAASYGIYDYVQQNQAVENAVEVDATVVKTSIDTVSSRRGGPNYKPEATYEYRYQGESYTSNNVFPATLSEDYDTRAEAESVLEGYESSETVTAYVVPDSPSNAFLVNETSNGPLLFTAIGGAFVLVGGWSAFKSFAGP